MNPRLPLASADELREELALIAEDRRRLDGRITSQEARDNRLASLKDWEDDLLAQLAELEAGAPCRREQHTAGERPEKPGRGRRDTVSDDPKFVTLTLRWCNARRAEDGKAPLKKLPLGVRRDPASCPCGKATGWRVLNKTAERKGRPTRRIPLSVQQFVSAFDNECLPQFDHDAVMYEREYAAARVRVADAPTQPPKNEESAGKPAREER